MKFDNSEQRNAIVVAKLPKIDTCMCDLYRPANSGEVCIWPAIECIVAPDSSDCTWVIAQVRARVRGRVRISA